MARFKLRLDHAGIGAILKSADMMRAVQSATRSITANARMASPLVEGEPGKLKPNIENSMSVTDRAHGTVTIAHPSGMAIQAKHGLLTQAAAGAGLEVTARGPMLQYTTKAGKTRSATAAQIANWTRGRG